MLVNSEWQPVSPLVAPVMDASLQVKGKIMNGKYENQGESQHEVVNGNCQGPYHEDEIDLVDLAAVLYRKRLFILLSTVLVCAVALLVAFIMPKKYSAVTLVEIGKIFRNGSSEKVESSNAIKNRYRSLSKYVVTQIDSPDDEGLPFSIENDLEIDIPEDGNIVELSVESIKDKKVISFLENLNESFVGDHNRIFDQERSYLRSEIDKEKLKQENVDIHIRSLRGQINSVKREYEEKIGRKRSKIVQIQNEVQNLKSYTEFIKDRVNLLEGEKETLKAMIKESEKRYAKQMQSKMDANIDAKGAGAVALMLFSNEIQNIQMYIDKLKKRLLFDIPSTVNELESDLKEVMGRIENKKSELELEKKMLAQIKPEMKDKIDDIEGKIEEKKFSKKENALSINVLKSKLNNMITTQVIVEPHFSDNPASKNIKLMGVLGLVLGLFVGIFGAFVLEFWQTHKKRITQG